MEDILSTKLQMESFKNSFIWKDIVNTLISWDNDLDIEHAGVVDTSIEENYTSARVLLHMGDISGRRKAIKYFIAIPDIIIEALKTEDKKDDTER